LNLVSRLQDSPPATKGGPREQARAWVGVVVLLAALAPALAAMAVVPWFVTQDGPAHLYNAEVLARSFDADSPFGSSYRVQWEPLPNWAGHLLLIVLSAIATPRGANLAINALTLAGFSASVLWLRWVVAGPRGLGIAALLAAALGLNVAWLLGFTSFMLGACLFPMTLGVWWTGRDRLDGRRVAALSAMLVLGYFGHLVSLALTVLGLAVLALRAPCGDGRRAWAARLGRTALSTLPLVPLGLVYLNLTRRGGRMRPEWGHLADPFSPRAWLAQLGWADPISIAAKGVLPFGPSSARVGGLLAPAAWLLIALGLALAATLRARVSDPVSAATTRRGWTALAAMLILGGLVGPDTLGVSHGHYLPQRIVLLGLAALVPALDLDPRRRAVQGCALALVVALAVQSALVWDYARVSQRTAGAFWQARDVVGRRQRVATLLLQLRDRFRANPLLHADCLLGLETGNIIWSNYETRHYYFPVQFRAGLDRPDASELERLALQDDPRDADVRTEAWEQLLRRRHASIDVLVVWGSDPRLDAISDRWFQSVSANGTLRILRHR
jgi:hypothetical protein